MPQYRRVADDLFVLFESFVLLSRVDALTSLSRLIFLIPFYVLVFLLKLSSIEPSIIFVPLFYHFIEFCSVISSRRVIFFIRYCFSSVTHAFFIHVLRLFDRGSFDLVSLFPSLVHCLYFSSFPSNPFH